jgi:hypothetical protein
MRRPCQWLPPALVEAVSWRVGFRVSAMGLLPTSEPCESARVRFAWCNLAQRTTECIWLDFWNTEYLVEGLGEVLLFFPDTSSSGPLAAFVLGVAGIPWWDGC